MTETPQAVRAAAQDPNRRIDTTQPHTARIWNYWLGGKDNYEVDRATGDRIRQLHPASASTPAPTGSSWAAPWNTW